MNKNEQINEILTRGVEAVYPSADFLKSRLEKDEKPSLYLGIDPTGPTLHLGHAIALQKLAQFQRQGCKVTLLMGDFTALIGDPTDKKAARVQMTKDEVAQNMKLYKKQAEVFLDFGGKNPAEIKHNSEWLSKMNFEDVLNLASKMTVSQMLERDMFETRMREGKPIYLHEFLYPLMQGYDSVAMEVDGEIGGNDQTFNMLVGRNFLKEMKGKEKFVLTLKLLTDKENKKMGKTEGNMLSLEDSAEMMFGKIMSWEDSMIISGFELCTMLPMDEVKKIHEEMLAGGNPRDAKMRLALEVTKIYHGEEKAEKAQENFVSAFQKKEMPDDVPEICFKDGESLVDILMENKLLKSKSEWRRLVEEGAVSINGEKISDLAFKPSGGESIKLGKKKFLRLKS